MKKLLSLLLIAALVMVCFTGCGKKKDEGSEQQGSGGLTQALEDSGSVPGYTINDEEWEDTRAEDAAMEEPADEPQADESAADEPASEEAPTEDDGQNTTSENGTVISRGEVIPFATEAPQPNAVVTSYSEIKDTGLGFKFNYPTGWINYPGRSTICYVQPMTNGTIYPGRVSVTMKRLLHPCGDEEMIEELTSYRDMLNKQFSNMRVVGGAANLEDRFMGKKAISFEYMAYDGSQEIKGYVVMTHFERYVFAYHFLCAYGDYNSFSGAMVKMKDSVQVEEEKR